MTKEALRLSYYSPMWKQEFEQSKSLLLWAAEGWLSDIQHVGGTRIQGSVTRPVIDMVAGLTDISGLNQVSSLIEGLNYARIETPLWCDSEFVAHLQKPRFGAATHAVLVVRHGGEIWQRVAALQAWLETHVDDANRLRCLKLERAATSADDLDAYTRSKCQFFEELHRSIRR